MFSYFNSSSTVAIAAFAEGVDCQDACAGKWVDAAFERLAAWLGRLFGRAGQ